MAGRARTAALCLQAAAALLAAAASAQSGSSWCTSALVSLSPCLDYTSGNETTAPSSCSSQLETVVRLPLRRARRVVRRPSAASASTGRARSEVQTPPVGECNGTGSGSKETPTTSYLVSGSTSLRGPVGLVVVSLLLLIISSYVQVPTLLGRRA